MILQVIWVEHVEVDDRAVHNLYRPLVNSGLAFGAKRWVATLDRQCERLASSMASNIPAGDLCGKSILTPFLILLEKPFRSYKLPVQCTSSFSDMLPFQFLFCSYNKPRREEEYVKVGREDGD